MQVSAWTVERPGEPMVLRHREIRPAEGEVIVEVAGCGVCHTDLGFFYDGVPTRHPFPLTLGHEFAGTVVEVGRLVKTVQVGDYVSAESHVTCGMCFHCRTGQAHLCPQTRILGVDRPGAFADYVVVPESVIWQNDRSKLPPEIATLPPSPPSPPVLCVP